MFFLYLLYLLKIITPYLTFTLQHYIHENQQQDLSHITQDPGVDNVLFFVFCSSYHCSMNCKSNTVLETSKFYFKV